MPNKTITKRKGRYSDKIRNSAGVEYAVCGSIAQVHKSTGIPKTTPCMWKNKGTWDELIAEVRTQNTNRHIAQYDTLTEKALDVAENGIDKLKDKDLSASDIKSLIISGAASTDKSRLLQNQPTSITSKTESMETMAERFRAIADQLKHAIPVNLIDVTPEDIPKPGSD